MIRRIINWLLRKLGYALVKVEQGSGFTAERIGRLGSPRTIIDVGVAGGTRALYDAFPGGHLVLVEPLPDSYEGKIKAIREKYKTVTLVETAAGEAASTAEINIETNGSSRSSFMKRTSLTETKGETIVKEIQIQTLDEIVSKNGLEGPFGIKIDTEGFELNVIRGCQEILPQIEFFIVEVSIAKRFEDSYTFEELVEYMDSINFVVTDMLDFARPDQVGTRFLDLVFQPRAR